MNKEYMENNFYTLIMAGGVGSRLWPISTTEYPKQFHDILGVGETLIQKTFNRCKSLVPINNILVSTNKNYDDLVLSQLNGLNENNMLLEPVMRNTAPSILYAALKIYEQNEDAIMLVAPSDHWVENEEDFLKDIKFLFKNCSENDILMTIGVKPNSPNTGYGYIHVKNEINKIKKVNKFVEKPKLEIAEKFLKDGNYLWNSGIFVWSVKAIIKAFKGCLPLTFNVLNNGQNKYNTNVEKDFINENYKYCENVSIDFGIMEHVNNVYVLPVNFGWSDLGTWNSLYKTLKKDDLGNVTIGDNVLCQNSKNNIINVSIDKKIVIQDLNDFIVVEKDNVILICPRKNEQNVKEISLSVKKK